MRLHKRLIADLMIVKACLVASYLAGLEMQSTCISTALHVCTFKLIDNYIISCSRPVVYQTVQKCFIKTVQIP